MISIANYTTSIKSVDVKSLPQTLKEGHQFFIEAGSLYDQDEIIKETIDIYIQKLNEYLARNGNPEEPDSGPTEVRSKSPSPSKAKEKVKTVKPKTQAPQKSPVPGEKASSKSNPSNSKNKSQPKMVAFQSKDVAFIKRFVNMHNRVKSRHQINIFIRALQKAIVGREIRKTSKHAYHIKEI